MPQIWLSLGSNQRRKHHLCMAMRRLGELLGEAQVSPVYESDAEGFSGPDFYNLIAGFETEQSAEELIALLYRIEDDLGRIRGEQKFSSRSIDIDLLTYGDQVISVSGKELPREDILDYAFVLKPLADIAPQQLHPLTAKSYLQHWLEFSPKPPHMKKISSDFLNKEC
ncbi:MAG: 2-amino-4-hydroxy-6-hydroxymethyldihydropteridine diphosphokinase [Gammaproteobacteria bacterium]|nr:2-amino-4-hydroxy-6-hydroxymethyldihydropteridine diphosphokinase [Gammaproteobacteria bacterium]